MHMKAKSITVSNRIYRQLWNIVSLLLFYPSPRFMHGWRVFLLRVFQAKVGRGTHIYPKAKIWAPWNLEIGDDTSIDDYVDCYNVDKIIIGNKVSISKYAFLCTASHDYHDKDRQLITSPIYIESGVWISAGVFIGPGVRVGKNSIILAKVVLLKDIDANTKVKVIDNYSFSPRS